MARGRWSGASNSGTAAADQLCSLAPCRGLLTVGIMSSWNDPVVSTLTSELLPAFCNPIKESSISRLKNRLWEAARQHQRRQKRSDVVNKHPSPRLDHDRMRQQHQSATLMVICCSLRPYLRSQSRMPCHQAIILADACVNGCCGSGGEHCLCFPC